MSSPASSKPRPGPADWRLEFVERSTALLADTVGLPPSHIRVLAWLIVCEPPQQSVEEIRAALGLSRGAISMATSTLARMGAIERVALPRTRRLAYRIGPGIWERLMRLRLEAMSRMRSVTEEALLHAPPREPRLEEMRDIYAWFEKSTADFLAGRGPAR